MFRKPVLLPSSGREAPNVVDAIFSVSGYHRNTQVVEIYADPVSETSNDGQRPK